MPRQSTEVRVAVLGLALVVALSVVAAVLSPPASEGLASGSSFSKEPDGSAAAFQTLQSLGYRVTRSFDPLTSLQADPSGTVIILADPSELASNGDRRALVALVTAGAVVLVSGCHGGSFLSELQSAPARRPDRERAFAAEFPAPLSAGAPRISMDVDCEPPNLGARYTSLYGDNGASVVRFARIGAGIAIWWAANTPLTNRAIDAPGHLELLLNVAGAAAGRAVLWDEFYHGQRRSLYSYAKLTPLPWLVAQTGLIAVVAAAMFVRRRAPIVERFVEPRTSPLEFVETMAGLYARASTGRDAVVTARDRLRRLLLEATGLARSTGDDRLAAAAALRTRLDGGDLAAALRAADAASAAGSVTPEEALPLVRRLQTFALALDRRGG